jgi:hypothetical protein
MSKGIRRGGWLAGALAAAVLAAIGGEVRAADAGRVIPVPLGGSIGGQQGDRTFGVYVPTRFGGNLGIKASSGRVEALTGPDGKVRTNGEDVGMDAHGWYTFRVVGAAGPYTVTNEYVQVGQAARLPWNF